MKKLLLLLALGGCSAERALRAPQENRYYDQRPILRGPTKGHQRIGLPPSY